jgi:hypothetical protein
MAYMNQDKKKVIKANLDKVLKPLGIKYSLRVQDHMSINCTIKSGAVDFIGNFKATTGDKFTTIPNNHLASIQVNPYWYNEHFTGDARDIINKVIDGLKSANYYDRSDAQVDYFDTAYYMHLNIGDWDKPYKLEATK